MMSESSDEYSDKINPCSHYSLIQLLEYSLNFAKYLASQQYCEQEAHVTSFRFGFRL